MSTQTNGQATNSGSVMSEIGSTYKPPAASSQPSSYTPKANPSVIDNWKESARDIVNNKQTQQDIKDFFGSVVDWASPLLQAMGLGWIQSFFNKGESQRQEEAQIRSEGRANAEYDRRLADMREYENPIAVAQRYAAAGINPLSVMTNGGPMQSQVSGPSASSPSAFNNNLGGLSGLSSILQTPTKIDLNKAKTENTDVDTILKNWDVLLKDQLWNYNNAANPILLEKAGQELANLRQTYNNLVSTEGLQKAQTSEVYKKMQKLEEEITLLVFQQALTQEQTAVEEQKWRKLVEEVTGRQIENKTNRRIWEDLYESGEFKKKTVAERKRIQSLANQAMAEFQVYARKYRVLDEGTLADVMQSFMIFAEMVL